MERFTIEVSHDPDINRFREFFKLVHHPKDWRAPINALVSLHADLAGIKEAVARFTGSDCQFSIGYRIDPDSQKKIKGIRVRADGYWETMNRTEIHGG